MRPIFKSFIDHEIIKSMDMAINAEFYSTLHGQDAKPWIDGANQYLDSIAQHHVQQVRQCRGLEEAKLDLYQVPEYISAVNLHIRGNSTRNDLYEAAIEIKTDHANINKYMTAVNNYQKAARDAKTPASHLIQYKKNLAMARAELPATMRQGLAAAAQAAGIPVPLTGNSLRDELEMIRQLDMANPQQHPTLFASPATNVPRILSTLTSNFSSVLNQQANYVKQINIPASFVQGQQFNPPKVVKTALTWQEQRQNLIERTHGKLPSPVPVRERQISNNQTLQYSALPGGVTAQDQQGASRLDFKAWHDQLTKLTECSDKLTQRRNQIRQGQAKGQQPPSQPPQKTVPHQSRLYQSDEPVIADELMTLQEMQNDIEQLEREIEELEKEDKMTANTSRGGFYNKKTATGDVGIERDHCVKRPPPSAVHSQSSKNCRDNVDQSSTTPNPHSIVVGGGRR